MEEKSSGSGDKGKIEDDKGESVSLTDIYKARIQFWELKKKSEEEIIKDRKADFSFYLTVALGLNLALSSPALAYLNDSGIPSVLIFSEIFCTVGIISIYEVGKNYIRRRRRYG